MYEDYFPLNYASLVMSVEQMVEMNTGLSSSLAQRTVKKKNKDATVSLINKCKRAGFIYMTARYVFYCVVKSFIFGKHSNASGILENPPWFYSHFMWAVINQLWEIEKWDWDYSTRGLEPNPSKVLSFCDWNL